MLKILNKNKKIIKLIISLLIILFIFYIFLHSKNYEIMYNINSVEITENYDKTNKIYKFLFKVNEKEYIVQLENKYLRKKKLINKVEIKEYDNTTCIIPESKKLKLYPLCYQNDEQLSYHLIEKKDLLPSEYYKNISSEKSKYNNVKINYLNNKKYYIWNYKGFYVIDGKKNQTINIFDDDIYNIPLSYKINNNILLADYNSKYNFNKFYLIQTKNNKIKEINTDKELSFEAYILGSYKNKVYFMDKKNKKEYEINTKKLSINNMTKSNKGKTLEKDEWKEISINKLSTEEYLFTSFKPYDYQIVNNKLYLIIDNHKIKISNNDVKEIVQIDGETVYYIVNDKLYYYNYIDGEVLIMSYFEWNFNYKNMIYIF